MSRPSVPASLLGLALLACGPSRVRPVNAVPPKVLIYARCSLEEARAGTPVGDFLPRSPSCASQSHALFETAPLLLDRQPLWVEADGRARIVRYSRAAGFPELFVVVTVVPQENGELAVVVRRDRLQAKHSDHIQPEFIQRTVTDVDGKLAASCFAKEMVDGDPAASQSDDYVTAIEVVSGDRYAAILTGDCAPNSATAACRCQREILGIARSLWTADTWELAPPPPGMSY
ncbi:MAG: hypothetical protein JNL79_06690 [Myxococcales bacterium]|nr:hypothetical protein [Myxococcales bacterium]